MIYYQSDHFIVYPCNNYETDVDVSLLTCEIQVRTLLQHAYSEVSHAFVYKQNKDIDSDIKRKLAAAMAFLEEADQKFLSIFTMNTLSKDIRLELTGKLNEEFGRVCENYQAKSFDNETLYVFMDLLSEERQKEILSNLSNFVEEHHADFKDAYENFDFCYLFTQPVSLLALYSFDKWQDFTKNSWPYAYNSLEYVVKALGKSSDVL